MTKKRVMKPEQSNVEKPLDIEQMRDGEEAAGENDTPALTSTEIVAPELPKKNKMTPTQIREAVKEVEKLLAFPDGNARARRFCQERYGWRPNKTRKIIDRVHAMWVRIDEKESKYTKMQAVRRIGMGLEMAYKKGSLNAAAALEAQLARIQGTEIPNTLKVDVALSDALTGVLAGMDVATLEAMAKEYDQLSMRAHAILPEVIEGEVVEESTLKKEGD